MGFDYGKSEKSDVPQLPSAAAPEITPRALGGEAIFLSAKVRVSQDLILLGFTTADRESLTAQGYVEGERGIGKIVLVEHITDVNREIGKNILLVCARAYQQTTTTEGKAITGKIGCYLFVPDNFPLSGDADYFDDKLTPHDLTPLNNLLIVHPLTNVLEVSVYRIPHHYLEGLPSDFFNTRWSAAQIDKLPFDDDPSHSHPTTELRDILKTDSLAENIFRAALEEYYQSRIASLGLIELSDALTPRILE